MAFGSSHCLHSLSTTSPIICQAYGSPSLNMCSKISALLSILGKTPNYFINQQILMKKCLKVCWLENWLNFYLSAVQWGLDNLSLSLVRKAFARPRPNSALVLSLCHYINVNILSMYPFRLIIRSRLQFFFICNAH